MTHVSDGRLVLLQYGELPPEDAARVREHLAACEACRAAERRLRDVLAAVELPAPELADDYETTLWARLAPRLTASRQAAGWPARRRLRLAAATLLAAGAATVIGIARLGHERARPVRAPAGAADTAAPLADLAEARAQAASEQILLGALDDHLARVEQVLVEIANAGVDDADALAVAQAEAADLVDASRLYRLTASRAGDAAIVGALEDIERALVEIARSPTGASRREREAIIRRVDPDGVLFRLRTRADQLRTRTGAAAVESRVVSN